MRIVVKCIVKLIKQNFTELLPPWGAFRPHPPARCPYTPLHSRDGSSGVLVVDNGPTVTRQSVEIPRRRPVPRRGLFVGGMPRSLLRAATGYRSGVQGCVADLVLNTDYRLRLANRSATVGHGVADCEV